MSEKDRSVMEEAALAVAFHAAQRIKEGKSHEDIITELEANGVKRADAERLLERIDQSRSNVARRSGYRNLALGVVLMVVIALPLLGIIGTPLTGALLMGAYILLGFGVLIVIRALMQITGL